MSTKADISAVKSYLYGLRHSGWDVPKPILGAIDRIEQNHLIVERAIEDSETSLKHALYEGGQK